MVVELDASLRSTAIVAWPFCEPKETSLLPALRSDQLFGTLKEKRLSPSLYALPPLSGWSVGPQLAAGVCVGGTVVWVGGRGVWGGGTAVADGGAGVVGGRAATGAGCAAAAVVVAVAAVFARTGFVETAVGLAAPFAGA